MGLESARKVSLDGVDLEVLSQSPEDGIVVAVPDRDPGAAILSVTGDAGSHSTRVVFGVNPARLSIDGQRASWNAVPGAAGYALWIGSEVGKSDLAEVPLTPLLTADLPVLPSGKAFARLWTLSGGIWSYRDTTVELP
jgi:hypothetical protein